MNSDEAKQAAIGQAPARSREGVHYALVVLVVSLFTVMGALGLARFGYTLLLPGMKEGLSLSFTQTGMLATWNLIGYLFFAAVGGAVAAKCGPHIVISLSMLLVGAGMFLTGLAPSFLTALVLRTLTGVGSAGANVPVMGLISAWFSAERRGMAAGIAVGGSGVGLALTGPLLPSLIAAYGWRTGWYLLGSLGLLIGVTAYLFLRNRPEEKGLRPFGEKLKLLPLQDSPAGPKAALSWGLVYRSSVMWHLAAVYATFGFSYIIYVTFFSVHLTREGGWSPTAAGGLWAMIGILSIFSGFIWGSVSDRAGRKYGLALVFLLQGLAILIFGFSRNSFGFYSSAVLFGLTAWSIPGIMAAACGDYVGSRLAPAALGFITVIFGIGQAFGPSVAGAIADSSGSFAPALIAAALVEWLGAGGALLLKKPEPS